LAYTNGSFSAQAQPGFYLYNNVIAPFLTANAGPIWSHIEDTVQGTYTYSVWKSAAAANHSGMDWYVVFQYQTAAQSPGSIVFNVYACEVYNTSGHTWNRPTLATNSSFAGTYTAFDAANQRAYTAASPNVVGTVYPIGLNGASGVGQNYQALAGLTVSATVLYQLVANADGFLLAVNGSASSWCYVGAFSSFLPAGGPFGADQPLAIWGDNLTGVAGGRPGLSRDPVANGVANTAPYFWGVGLVTFYGLSGGQVNGVGDSYQTGGAAGAPWAQRLLISKVPLTFSGINRGMSPAWLLYIPVSGSVVSFGDTIVVSPGPVNGAAGDTYAYITTSTNGIWADTAA
jgi:hypothetical protein